MTNPLEPMITTAQIRHLHTFGLSHDDLRFAAGVQSLKQLTRRQAMDLIDRLKSDRPDGGAEVSRRARRGRSAVGVIKPASARQRSFIRHLLRDCGWPLEHCRAWMRQRWEVDLDGLDAAPLSAGRAARIIGALQQARANVMRHRGDSPPPVPAFPRSHVPTHSTAELFDGA